MNTVHSLYLLKVTPENKLPSVAFHLQELNEMKTLVNFGFGSYQKLTPFTTKLDTLEGHKESAPPEFVINSAETVVMGLRNVIEALSPNTWHKGWLDLTLETAFTSNPALQPRAFVTLGVIINKYKK